MSTQSCRANPSREPRESARLTFPTQAGASGELPVLPVPLQREQGSKFRQGKAQGAPLGRVLSLQHLAPGTLSSPAGAASKAGLAEIRGHTARVEARGKRRHLCVKIHLPPLSKQQETRSV